MEDVLGDGELGGGDNDVAGCAICNERLESIEDQSDSLVRALAALPATPDDEETFQQVQATLLAHPFYPEHDNHPIDEQTAVLNQYAPSQARQIAQHV